MGIPEPALKQRKVVWPVGRRDYIPEGEALKPVEAEQVRTFGRTAFNTNPDYIPQDAGEENTTAPLGDPDVQQEEAIRLVKEKTKADLEYEASGAAKETRLAKLGGLNVGDSIEFLMGLSPQELEKYRELETRTTVKRHFGWQ